MSTNSVFTGLPTTIFETMSRLAIETNAINLGQGFPDVDGPEDIRKVAADSILTRSNQYPPMLGLPELRQSVANINKKFYGLDIDWKSEVMITSGATEALCDSIFAIVEEGDEVILIEPLYDCYLPLVRRAGGKVKTLKLTPPNWQLNFDELENVFSDRTKLILLNNPMNPAAKVFNENELAKIAELCIKYDVYALCDEVYEHIIFDNKTHKPLMTFEGMRDRTVRIGSAGKTFSLTGWKVGYITASANLLAPISKAHQFVTFTTPPNLQVAVSFGLEKEQSYFDTLKLEMQTKRDRIIAGLNGMGVPTLPCEGTYFVTCDFTKFNLGNNDTEIAERLTREAGVASVPISAFYVNDIPMSCIRFCFCKRDEIIDEALSKLSDYLSCQ